MAEDHISREDERRQAALLAMDRFADQQGVINREWREVDQGDTIVFIGTSPAGREFAVGYEKVRANA